MTLKAVFAAALLCAAPALATPAWADEPGPGGSRPPVPATGQQVYEMVCQACHMADARGASGAATIPALAANRRLAQPAYPVVMVLKGRGAMPWFNDSLTPAQIAAVVTYIRTNFGNNYPAPVTEADVARFAGH
jgi:mono/diheme cytochrome c family protein